MKIASYNIHKCRGTDGLVKPERIVAVIKEFDADLVALQEVDHRIGARTGLLDPAMIERETGLRLLTQSDIVDGHGWHGNALLVRGELRHYHRSRIHLPGIEPRVSARSPQRHPEHFAGGWQRLRSRAPCL